MTKKALYQLLETEAAKRNCSTELCDTTPDPLIIARREGTAEGALVAALFAYGNVRAILGFLHSLDFSLLYGDEAAIPSALSGKYYRFQNDRDVAAFFIGLNRLQKEGSLETFFLEGFRKEENVLDGLASLIGKLEALCPGESRGLRFLLGTAPVPGKEAGASALKRWHMFLRWMVRKDCLDMGLWEGVGTSRLILPLDTHTHAVSRKLGLTRRKNADLKTALEITAQLRRLDPEDPVKYDFALYRIGQEGLIP